MTITAGSRNSNSATKLDDGARLNCDHANQLPPSASKRQVQGETSTGSSLNCTYDYADFGHGGFFTQKIFLK